MLPYRNAVSLLLAVTLLTAGMALAAHRMPLLPRPRPVRSLSSRMPASGRWRPASRYGVGRARCG